MRYTQLRSFHAVASTESVTVAAQMLNVSQPTLTSQIRGLEEEYGIELFVRTGGRLRITEAGRELQKITFRMFAQEAEARHFLSESQELRTGHLVVGAVGPFHVTEMLVAFHARYPEITISVSVGNSQQVLDDLLNFRSDIAILASVQKDSRLWMSRYSNDQIVAFARRDHPLFQRGKRGIKIAELHNQPMVARELGSNTRLATDRAMAQAGVTPNIVMTIGSREAVREAVASGVGLGMVSQAEYIADDRTICLPIVDAKIFNSTHVACMRDRVQSRIIAAFLEVVEGLRRKKQQSSRRGS